jgi:hypothetical protein
MRFARLLSRHAVLVSCALALSLQSVALAQKLRPIDRQLHSAAEKGDLAIDRLVTAGAAVNAADDKGRTPLHKAVDRRRRQAVRLLARLGADAEARDADGRSPRDLARQPKSRALDLEAAIDLGIAERIGTIEALRRYDRAHPSPIDLYNVRARIRELEREEADWTKAVRADAASGYQSFLNDHARSRHAPEAASRLEHLREEGSRWSAVEAAPSIDGYDAFIRDFPGSRQLVQARQLRELLAADTDFARVRTEGTLQAWEGFVRSHPESAHRAEAGRRIEELTQDPTREQVRADIATVHAGGAAATKGQSTRTLLFVVPQLGGADRPDGLLIKKSDYSYFAIGPDGPQASASAFEVPLLRYLRPAEVGVFRISERTLLADDQLLNDRIRDLYVALAKASDLPLSQVRFVMLHSFAASHRRDVATKNLTNRRRHLLALLAPDDQVARWLPRLGVDDRRWAVDLLRMGRWTPASPGDTANWEAALSRWDRVRALGDAAVAPLQQMIVEGQTDMRVAATDVLNSIDPSRDAADWAESRRLGTLRGYDAYVSGHPAGAHAAEATALLTRLRTDDGPVEAAFKAGTEKALKEVLDLYPGHARHAEVARVLADLQTPREVVDLLADRTIEVKVIGKSIQSVTLSVRRIVPYPVNVRIPFGSYFIAAASSAQNMVATSQHDLTIQDDQWHTFSIDAACANRPRRIPGSGDSFSVERPTHVEDLSRVVAALGRVDVPFAVRQAAVWIVTDNASYSDLGSLVSRPAGRPFGGTRVINETHTARAMKLIDSVGIDISAKAIWKDRALILGNVTDPPLRTWLESRLSDPRP